MLLLTRVTPWAAGAEPDACMWCAALMCAVLLLRADWQWEAAKARGLVGPQKHGCDDDRDQDHHHGQDGLENGNQSGSRSSAGAVLYEAPHSSWGFGARVRLVCAMQFDR